MIYGITVEEFLALSPIEDSIVVNLTDEDLSSIIPAFSTFQMSPTEVPNQLNKFSLENNYLFISNKGQQGEVLCRYFVEKGYHVNYLIGGLHSLQNHLVMA